MRKARQRSVDAARVPRARNANSRQRQLLIDACISALHIHGPSRTTVEKVVAIARMSPGIVRFYFASKAAMLVASLQFLAAEFDEQLLIPVTRLKSKPVAALELLVELYLDPEIASPRKVSVWYAFWGEASSRQEYYDICGQKDEGFAALVRELIERLIVESGQPHLSPDGIALGLIGVLEMLWQDFAFRTETDIDRPAAKRRAMAYLRSVFPGRFADAARGTAEPLRTMRLAAWVYADRRVFAAEREALFQGSWQLAAHRAEVPEPGDFRGIDLGVERVLLVRGRDGELRAFRNNCPEAPHSLVAAPRGRGDSIECRVHGLRFGLDGRRLGAAGAPDLMVLDHRTVGDLILVREADAGRRTADLWEGAADPWAELAVPADSRLSTVRPETQIQADWKLVIEHWLECELRAAASPGPPGWSLRSYLRLLGSASQGRWQRRFIAPNHLVELRPDGFTVLQVLPCAPGSCRVRTLDSSLCEAPGPALAAGYLAWRQRPQSRAATIAVIESIQQGLVTFGYAAADGARAAPAATAFRRRLIDLMPLLGLARPPNENS
jgi:TetR/AcrR family transcriptional repressor of bet genes